jgi:hypothetical protein
MTEEKSERLGLRGRLAHLESALRLLGTGNTTGAVAAGAAFHAFENNADIQNAVKVAAICFLAGIFAFGIAYAFLFMATQSIDHSLPKEGKRAWPEYWFWASPTKSAAEYKREAKFQLVVVTFASLASFVLFFFGLGLILLLAIRLQLGGSQ